MNHLTLTPCRCALCGGPRVAYWLNTGPGATDLRELVCEPCGKQAIRRAAAEERSLEAYRQRYAGGEA